MRRLLLLVGAIVFVDSMFFAALTPLLPAVRGRARALEGRGRRARRRRTRSARSLGGIPAGLSAARLGVKPTVLVGLAGMTVTTLTFGFADSYWLLLTARFVQGVASAFSWTAGLAWLVAAAPRGRRGELIGAAMGSAIFGALFGPVVGAVASVAGRSRSRPSRCLPSCSASPLVRTPAFAPGRQPLSILTAGSGDRAAVTAGWLIALPGLVFGAISVLGPLRLDELGFGGSRSARRGSSPRP